MQMQEVESPVSSEDSKALSEPAQWRDKNRQIEYRVQLSLSPSEWRFVQPGESGDVGCLDFVELVPEYRQQGGLIYRVFLDRKEMLKLGREIVAALDPVEHRLLAALEKIAEKE